MSTGSPPSSRQVARARAITRRKVDRLRDAVWDVERAALAAPKFDPVYVVFFQRLFPLDAINMGLLNELVDPLFGEDEEVLRLIREKGPPRDLSRPGGVADPFDCSFSGTRIAAD